MSNVSPYSQSYAISYDDGDITLERNVFPYQPSKSDRIHTVMDGETIFSIASKYYGDSGYWGLICDVNFIYNPADEVIPGLEIIIPNG